MDHRTYGKTRNCKGCRYWSRRKPHHTLRECLDFARTIGTAVERAR